MTLERILVATDFSEASAAALAYARDLAHAFGARLDLVHVVDDLAARFVDFPYAELGQAQTTIEENARAQIEALATADDRRQLQARTAVITSPSPATSIVGYATDHGADLIVMGTHGRNPVTRMFLGSVADRVVRTAPCPVLTVRERKPANTATGASRPMEVPAPQ
jgi:nucleotide-binding universal stress UspA family protein